ncbi:ATP-dependent DNA helicase RecG [bacterium]|nr:ATP-dependent DNA helicase RecG [bacterium]
MDQNILDTPIAEVKGIGPKRAWAFQSEDIFTLGHLLNFIPRRYLDKRKPTPICDLGQKDFALVKGIVTSIITVGLGKASRMVVTIADETSYLNLVWFNFKHFMLKQFRKGQKLLASGEVSYFKGFQMLHPEIELLTIKKNNDDKLYSFHPCYSLPESLKKKGIGQKVLRNIILDALQRIENIDDPIPESILKDLDLPSLITAYRDLHFPQELERAIRGRQRLAFNELFFFQLMMAKRRSDSIQSQMGIQFKPTWKLVNSLIKSLPFQLTNAQKRVLAEIKGDMLSGGQMHRLLEGEVGSGKTIVALIAMLMAVESGFQAALMAPTEILASQHYQKIQVYLEQFKELKVAFLTGGVSKVQKNKLKDQIASGEINILIGTHALLQGDVKPSKLGIVVVDEQHRFGVIQRSTLSEKGLNPEILVMTATPIPRSLALAYFGDMDLSVIDELPPGRASIVTFTRDDRKRRELYNFIRKQVEQGRQAYFVYPLVEESEILDLKAATQAYEEMTERVFPELRVDLIHGRMKEELKNGVMERFRAGESHILVSTTVIEVGIDVPNANVMVIEHAERFGLSQLHQLRGRIGRGEFKSYCILMVKPPLSENAQRRIQVMCKTGDGFKIAEEDLRIRGPGSFFGIRQHGLPDFAIADFVEDNILMRKAREEAFELIKADPDLNLKEHQLLRKVFIGEYEKKFHLYNIG